MIHEETIKFLSSKPEFQTKEENGTWTATVTHRSGAFFEIIVPTNCYEWFVVLRESGTGRELWQGWSDWYISGNVTKDNRDDFYARDIQHFIACVHNSEELRVKEHVWFHAFGKPFFRSLHLEIRNGDEWTHVEPGDLPAAVRL